MRHDRARGAAASGVRGVEPAPLGCGRVVMPRACSGSWRASPSDATDEPVWVSLVEPQRPGGGSAEYESGLQRVNAPVADVVKSSMEMIFLERVPCFIVGDL